MFNKDLIKTQKVTLEQQELLKLEYAKLSSILDLSYKTESIDVLKDLAKEIEEIEFKLQELWNFEKNPNYHKYWLEINKCECPKMDNLDLMYFGSVRIISDSCKIHKIKKD